MKENEIYLGLGYKKDQFGFWKTKHWGNENYAKLVQLICQKYPDVTIHTTGNREDFFLSAVPIMRMANVGPRFKVHDNPSLDKAFDVVSYCGMYVGNDTGMMHVAASCGAKVIGMFFLENSIIKSSPWCAADRRFILDGTTDRNHLTPELVLDTVEKARKI